ncbi:MFS transporter [Amycolatopsis magusensis]|uniref:MFS transporter n=1 Tax=Amycolatopsis magusensis TaxID=882444 RepID=UPI0037ACD82C
MDGSEFLHRGAGGEAVSGVSRLGLLSVLFAQFLGVLDGLIVSVAIPEMAASLDIDVGDAHWVLNAYSVAFAGLLPLGGKLADMFGRRRSFVAGQVLLSAGSLLGAFSPNLTVVLIARILQATGAAVSTPAGVSMLADSFRDERERSRAFGWLPIGGGVGWVSAALFGGVLTAAFGWQSVFLVNLPISLAAIAFARIGFRTTRPPSGGERISWRSSVLLVLALAVAVYALGGAEKNGLLSYLTIGGLLVAAALGGVFTRVALRDANPVLRLQLLRTGGVPGAALLGLALPVGFVATQFLGSIYLQDVAGLPPDLAGYVFLPLAATPLLVTTLVGKHYRRFGAGRSVAAGFGLAAAGLALTAVTPLVAELALMLLGFGLIGIGLTIVYVPLAVAAVSGTDDTDYGAASAIFATSNQVGGSLALAILSSSALAGTAAGEHRYTAAGLSTGLVVAAGMCLLAGLLAIPLLRRVDQLSAGLEPR